MPWESGGKPRGTVKGSGFRGRQPESVLPLQGDSGACGPYTGSAGLRPPGGWGGRMLTSFPSPGPGPICRGEKGKEESHFTSPSIQRLKNPGWTHSRSQRMWFGLSLNKIPIHTCKDIFRRGVPRRKGGCPPTGLLLTGTLRCSHAGPGGDGWRSRSRLCCRCGWATGLLVTPPIPVQPVTLGVMLAETLPVPQTLLSNLGGTPVF